MTARATASAAVSAVCVGAVVWWAVRQGPPRLPSGAGGWTALAAALAVYALATAARGERWHRILRRSGIPASRLDAHGLTAVGYMGNNVLPARAGDLLRSYTVAARTGSGTRHAIGTAVAERLLDAAALGIILAALATGLLGDPRLARGPALPALAAGAAVLVVLLAAAVPLRRRPALARARRAVAPLFASTRALASRHGLALLGASVVVWALEASVYLLVARALDLPLNLADAAALTAVTNLVALVPSGPGYVGTFDAAVLFGARALGVAGAAAVGYLLLLRFVLFVPITLLGLALLLTRYRRWAGPRRPLTPATSP